MPELTPNIGIKKPLGYESVNKESTNENWDIIDESVGDLQDKIGILTNLQTTEKTNLVGAVNEVKASAETPSGAQTKVDTHANRTDNPHGVTAAQIGVQAGAEVNQNAFSSIKVGATSLDADSKTDTFELVAGTNIALTPDAATDTITIAVTGKLGDADTVDGKHASDLAQLGAANTFTQNQTISRSGDVQIDLYNTAIAATDRRRKQIIHSVNDGYSGNGWIFRAKRDDGTYTDTKFDAGGGVVWTDNKIRINNGQLEFYDGGVWKPVAGGIIVASNTVQQEYLTEQYADFTATDYQRNMLLYKFLPKSTGEMVARFDLAIDTLVVPNNFYPNIRVNAVSGMAYRGSTGWQPPVHRTWLDYRLPVGTRSVNLSDTGGDLLADVSVQSTSIPYASYETILQVHEAVPVYLILEAWSSNSTSGATGTFRGKVRNIRLKYDLM